MPSCGPSRDGSRHLRYEHLTPNPRPGSAHARPGGAGVGRRVHGRRPRPARAAQPGPPLLRRRGELTPMTSEPEHPSTQPSPTPTLAPTTMTSSTSSPAPADPSTTPTPTSGSSVPARLRIVAWTLFVVALGLTSMIVSVRSTLMADISRSANTDVAHEVKELQNFAATGVDPRTSQPFTPTTRPPEAHRGRRCASRDRGSQLYRQPHRAGPVRRRARWRLSWCGRYARFPALTSVQRNYYCPSGCHCSAPDHSDRCVPDSPRGSTRRWPDGVGPRSREPTGLDGPGHLTGPGHSADSDSELPGDRGSQRDRLPAPDVHAPGGAPRRQ